LQEVNSGHGPVPLPVLKQLPQLIPDPAVVQVLIRAREVEPARVVQAFQPIAADLVATEWPLTPLRPPLTIAPPALVGLVRPAITLTARIKGRLDVLPPWLPADWFDDLFIQPVMAAPVFTRPMYEALDLYSREWLLPGLGKISQPDFVTVLVSNARFLESFLTGLSHEMARELLWRGFPTDQRGTYFRRFWDATKDELAQDLHRFTKTPLASHMIDGLNERDGLNQRVVLMVRGELIRRYPDAMVFAMLAADQDANGHPIFKDPAANRGKLLAPIQFHGHLSPDIALVGFDLTVNEIKTASAVGTGGWWFLIAEHPTAPRFGLREAKSGGTVRDALGWGDLDSVPPRLDFLDFLDPRATKGISDTENGPTTTFGADAASTAHTLLRDPVRAAFEATALLAPTKAIQP
nr:hypothetical protein [Actinomycetota bacterium]